MFRAVKQSGAPGICTGRCDIDIPSVSVFWFWPYLLLSIGSSTLLVGCLMLRVAWRQQASGGYGLIGALAVLAGLGMLMLCVLIGISAGSGR